MSTLPILRRTAFAAWLALIVVWMVFPFHYAVVTSLQTGTALFEPSLWPKAPTLANYRELFMREYFPANIGNSVVLALGVVSLSLSAGVWAAWALGRVDFKGRRVMLFAILAVSMFPQVAVLSGLYQMFISLREFMQDQWAIEWTRPWSLGWLAFSYTLFTLPFTVWTLTAYLRAVPQELEDAARIDGASHATIVRRIYLPVLKPALVTTGLMAFVATWNEFLFALSFTSREPERTATVAIAMIAGVADFQVPWGTIMAAAVVTTLPVLALVFVFQRRLVAGLMAGAVKG